MINSWKRAFKGELPLWKAFWIGHFLGYWVLSLILGLTGAALDIDIFFKPVLLIFIPISVYTIYKCSKNVKKPLWGKLAKIYAIIWALIYLAGVITIPIALYL